MVDYSVVERKIIDFAQNYPAIAGVSLGCCPEEPKVNVYYFLLGNDLFNPKRSDAISKLEITLAQNNGPAMNFTLAEWPAYASENYKFLGRVIWKR